MELGGHAPAIVFVDVAAKILSVNTGKADTLRACSNSA
jgi:hypothetical protein